ncbi:MAG TPA: nuclear transport factor 2 family protein [Stellaceae bacterium]|jgi:hypothetical protein
MADRGDLALWHALNELIADYWADVDEKAGQEAHLFYVPEGVYVVGNNRFEGRDAIASFYLRRRHGAALTRHIVSNLRVFREDAARTRMAGLMTLYRAEGKSPFQGAHPPAMIADLDIACRLDTDGRWRFESHVLRPFIVSGDMPASITIRGQSLARPG